MRFGFWAFLGFLILNFGFPAYAALDLSEIGVGARPLGLGKAYVAVADDASALFTNPAGLSQNDNLNIVSMSGSLLGDVNYLLLGAADMSPVGKVGIGYINASIGSIPLTSLVGSGPSLEAKQYSSADYGSNQLIFAYGSKLSRFLKNGAGNNVAFGLNLKIFSQGFTGGAAPPTGGDNPLNNATGAGLDADLGMMWGVNDWANLGLVFKNFLPESFGGRFVWQKNNVTEGIPMVIRGGGQFHLFGPTALRRSDDRTLDLSVDYENYGGLNRPATWHLGLEFRPLDMFYLRTGLDQKPKAAETGVGVDNNFAIGVGMVLGGFTFDYAYHQFGDLSENTTHFFSIGYRGEEKPKAKPKIGKPEKKKSTIPQPEIVSKPVLRAFSDVPEDYWAQKPISYLSTIGLMDGFSDGTFKPTKEITRAELAVLLVKAKGFTVTKDVKIKFKDVPVGDGDAPYISLAVEKKYLGYADGDFKPNKWVTRAEAAVVMARFSGLVLKSKIKQKPFDDIAVDHWAAPAIAADKEIGLFAYLAGQGFGPDLYLTRAEAVEIIAKTSLVKKQIEKLISGEK